MIQHMQSKLWRKCLLIERSAPALFSYGVPSSMVHCFYSLSLKIQAEKEAFEEAEKVRKAREEEVVY